MELQSDIKQRKSSVSNSASLCDTEGNAADEGRNLLSDAGVRSKTAISGSPVTLNNESSDISSDVTLNSQAISKAALEEAECISNMIPICKSIINTAKNAMDGSKKFIDKFRNTGKRFDEAHCNLFFLKHRAKQSQLLAETVANRIKELGNSLSTLAVESNTAKDVELMQLKIRMETEAAYMMKKSVYVTAYSLLTSTKELWQEMEKVIDMHSSHLCFRQRERTSEWTAGLSTMTSVLGSALLCYYSYLKFERDFEDLFLLVGCVFMISSAYIGLVKREDYFPMRSKLKKVNTTLKRLEEKLKKVEIFRTQ